MEELARIERRVVTGAVFGERDGATGATGATGAMGATGAEPGQMFAVPEHRSRGRVTLKFRVTTGARRYFRWLERMFRRQGPRGVTFLRYLCVVLIDAWRPRARSELAYAEVYARDGHRCTSPVCSRRDLTPHHVVFRSAGGDDRDENVTSLCVWCHLDGVHGGRLAVTAPADAMTWHIGRARHTVVEGRRRRQMRRRGSGLRLPSSGDGLQFFLRRSPTGCV